MRDRSGDPSFYMRSSLAMLELSTIFTRRACTRYGKALKIELVI